MFSRILQRRLAMERSWKHYGLKQMTMCRNPSMQRNLSHVLSDFFGCGGKPKICICVPRTVESSPLDSGIGRISRCSPVGKMLTSPSPSA